jgi:hypothetical protein
MRHDGLLQEDAPDFAKWSLKMLHAQIEAKDAPD